MTAKELEQIIPLQKEIKDLENQYKDFYDTETLREKISHLKKERDRLVKWIDDIEDDNTRIIFRCRYMKKMSFLAIAFKIGGYDESYARRKHNKFLKQSEQTEFKNI